MFSSHRNEEWDGQKEQEPVNIMRIKKNLILGIMYRRSISKEKYLLQIHKCLGNITSYLCNCKFYIDQFAQQWTIDFL